jgi:CBS domain-containing protein
MTQVRDIMQTEVVTVSPDTTLHDLARVFSEYDISGAPVVDEQGRVRGVVSTSDVIRFAAEEVDVNLRRFREGLVPSGDWVAEGELESSVESNVDRFLGSDLDDYVVENIMTSANFHVEPGASLAELAEFLLKGRIHRALVMEDNTLLGIVTTVDVLRAIGRGS